MFKQAQMMFLFTDSPLHAGSGRGFGAVDLPIQRERVSGLPMIQASGIKGAMRSRIRQQEGGATSPKLKAAFGPEKDASEHAGAISPGDARVLLFPMRSLAGVFAWTTSLQAIRQFVRVGAAINQNKPTGWDWTSEISTRSAWVMEKSAIVAGANRVVLEEYAFAADTAKSALVQSIGKWIAENALPRGNEYAYYRDKLPVKLVILPDEAFRDFTQTSTEIITRIRLNEKTKTADGGALWTEEHLPVDTLLYAPLASADPRMKNNSPLANAQEALNFVSGHLSDKRIQLGGDETVGRGMVSLRFGAMNSLTDGGGQ